METKVWYTSRTIWINALTVAAMVLAFLVDTQTAGGLPFSLDPRWVTLALGVVNIVLRSVTNQGVTRSKHE